MSYWCLVAFSLSIIASFRIIVVLAVAAYDYPSHLPPPPIHDLSSKHLCVPLSYLLLIGDVPPPLYSLSVFHIKPSSLFSRIAFPFLLSPTTIIPFNGFPSNASLAARSSLSQHLSCYCSLVLLWASSFSLCFSPSFSFYSIFLQSAFEYHTVPGTESNSSPCSPLHLHFSTFCFPSDHLFEHVCLLACSNSNFGLSLKLFRLAVVRCLTFRLSLLLPFASSRAVSALACQSAVQIQKCTVLSGSTIFSSTSLLSFVVCRPRCKLFIVRPSSVAFRHTMRFSRFPLPRSFSFRPFPFTCSAKKETSLCVCPLGSRIGTYGTDTWYIRYRYSTVQYNYGAGTVVEAMTSVWMCMTRIEMNFIYDTEGGVSKLFE